MRPIFVFTDASFAPSDQTCEATKATRWMTHQVLQRGKEAIENGCTELHIVGGLHHQRKFEWVQKHSQSSS